ncbi:MAG TPA: lysylphosphatidylglycerol synthase domain-containing protein [Bacteroidia bacterium]|nr:lysylphosphatidylglycerol synthase domain-containing protein [Bacteroidia bacterium]
MTDNKTKRKNYLILALKIAIVCISLWVIYRQVIVKENFSQSLNEYRVLLKERHTWVILSVLILMMFFNWLIEAVKWRVLMSKIQKVSLGLSLSAIFSGITVSFFTPNRIGEYAGRVLHLDSPGRIKAVLATLVGSMNQLLITVVAGVLALLITMKAPLSDMRFVYSIICGISIVALTGIVVFYFNVSQFYSFLHRIKFLKRFDKYTEVFTFYHRKELSKITLLSAVRYLVFTTQYVLLLYLFDVDIDILTAYRLIFLIFLIMAIVPTFALAELSIRGSVALYFMSPLSSDSTGIVAASFSLWFINLVIPAIIGAFTLFFVRLSKANR